MHDLHLLTCSRGTLLVRPSQGSSTRRLSAQPCPAGAASRTWDMLSHLSTVVRGIRGDSRFVPGPRATAVLAQNEAPPSIARSLPSPKPQVPPPWPAQLGALLNILVSSRPPSKTGCLVSLHAPGPTVKTACLVFGFFWGRPCKIRGFLPRREGIREVRQTNPRQDESAGSLRRSGAGRIR